MTHKLAQQISKRETFSEESKKPLIFQNHHPKPLNNWRIHRIIHTPLPSSYEENDPLEGNFFRPLPESTKEEYEIKSIIPEGKDLPISTKEKNRNTEFTDYITIRRNPFSSNVTKLRDTTWTYFPIQTNYIHAYTMTLLPDQPIRNHDRRTTTTWPTTVL